MTRIYPTQFLHTLNQVTKEKLLLNIGLEVYEKLKKAKFITRSIFCLDDVRGNFWPETARY